VKDKQTTRVPKLRFPEFRGVEGWKERPLADFLSESRLPGSKGNVAKKITVKLWGNGVFEKNDAIQGSINTQYFRRKAGQFIYSKLDFLNQAFGIIPPSLDNFESTVDLPCFDFADGLNPNFLLEYVKRHDFYQRLGETADGSRKAKRIHAETFLSFPIALPCTNEQHKIAECLSSVDELMAAQARKVDALKTHKKGLMQQLFPREGETQPRLRFPEFQNAGEWEMTTIGDLKPFVTSGSRGWAPFYAERGELFVRITNLWRDSIYLDLTDSKFVQLPPGSNEGVRTQLKEHDVLISITADIGIIGYVDESVPSPAYINQHIALVRFDMGQLCGKYVAYFLASEKSQRLFRASTDTGTKAGMSLIGIQKIKLMLPGLPEQQRIASCLSSLDALITAETQKLVVLKTHKKGLMQQLFPSPEAVEA